MQVHPDTFRQEPNYDFINHKGKACSYERYTVEVTINGDRRRTHCSPVFAGRMPVYGLAVRFSQGAKVWPGQATYWVEKVTGLQPNIDKRGYFTCVGFWSDFEDKKVASNHNAV